MAEPVSDASLHAEIEKLTETQLREVLNYLVLLNRDAVDRAMIYVQRRTTAMPEEVNNEQAVGMAQIATPSRSADDDELEPPILRTRSRSTDTAADGEWEDLQPIPIQRRPGAEDTMKSPGPIMHKSRPPRGDDASVMAPAKPKHQIKRQRRKELVVLCTQTPSTKEQGMNQDKAMVICKSRLIKPYIVLASDPSKAELISQLLEMSGITDHYAQFFLRHEGTYEFLGDFDKIESMNEAGAFTNSILRLPKRLGSKGSMSSTGSAGDWLETPLTTNEAKTTLVPEHLTSIHQPIAELSEDKSLDNDELFDPPKPPPPKKPLLEAAKKAAAQREAEVKQKQVSEPFTSLVGPNQPKCRESSDDESMEDELFDPSKPPPPKQPLLEAARKDATQPEAAEIAAKGEEPSPSEPEIPKEETSTKEPETEKPQRDQAWTPLATVTLKPVSKRTSDGDTRPPNTNTWREEIHLKSPGTNAPTPKPDVDEGEMPLVTLEPVTTVEKQIPEPQPSKPDPVVVQVEPPTPDPVVVQVELPKPDPVVVQVEPPTPDPVVVQVEPPTPDPVVVQVEPPKPDPVPTPVPTTVEPPAPAQPSWMSMYQEQEEEAASSAPSWVQNALKTNTIEKPAWVQNALQMKPAESAQPARLQTTVFETPVPVPQPEPETPVLAARPSPEAQSFSPTKTGVIGPILEESDSHDDDDDDDEIDQPEPKSPDRAMTGAEKFPGTGACYLVYHPVLGELNIHYSEIPIDGAVGVWTSPDIIAFKEAQGLSQSELIGNCAANVTAERKHYYTGWCQFVKAAKSMDATVTVLDVGLPVDFYLYQDGTSVKVDGKFETEHIDAAACVPKYHEFDQTLRGKKWSKAAKKAGSVAVFNSLKEPIKDYNESNVSLSMSQALFEPPSPVREEPIETPLATPAHAPPIETAPAVVDTAASVENPPPVIPSPMNAASGPTCYLLYETDSSGRLVLHYSKEPVASAIGMWIPGPGKTISGFKFTQNVGRSVLIGNCSSGVQGRKSYCSGWCQFVRGAKLINGQVTLWDPTAKGLFVDVWVYNDTSNALEQTVKLPRGVSIDVSKILAVACLPKNTQFFANMAVDIVKWLAEGNTIGAASKF